MIADSRVPRVAKAVVLMLVQLLLARDRDRRECFGGEISWSFFECADTRCVSL